MESIPFTLNPVLLILCSLGQTANEFSKHTLYWVGLSKITPTSLLILILVMLDVIELLVASITLRHLLYLNLPPNLFKSADYEYFCKELVTFALKSLTDPTKLEL